MALLRSIKNKREHGFKTSFNVGTISPFGSLTNDIVGGSEDEPFFTDRFITGAPKSANGWFWRGGPVTVVAFPGPYPEDTHCFKHIALESPRHNTEKRFHMGLQRKSLFLSYYMLHPEDYFHQDDDNPGPDNNKWVRVWSGDPADSNNGYSSYAVKGGFSTRCTYNPTTGDSRFIPEFGYSTSGCGGSGIGPWSHNDSAVVLGDNVRGIWTKFTHEFGLSSSIGLSDGILRLWKNDVLVFGYTDLDWYPRCVSGGRSKFYLDEGYILGAANASLAGQIFYTTRYRFGPTYASVNSDLSTGW